MDKESIESKIKKLTEARDTASSFEERLGLQDQIHALKMELEGTTLTGHEPIECIGCGS